MSAKALTRMFTDSKPRLHISSSSLLWRVMKLQWFYYLSELALSLRVRIKIEFSSIRTMSRFSGAMHGHEICMGHESSDKRLINLESVIGKRPHSKSDGCVGKWLTWAKVDSERHCSDLFVISASINQNLPINYFFSETMNRGLIALIPREHQKQIKGCRLQEDCRGRRVELSADLSRFSVCS